MPRSRALLTLVLVPLFALLVACGGDDDDGDSDSSSGGGDQPAATQSGGDQPEATEPSGDSGSSGSGGSSGDLEGAEILENCPELLSFLGAASAGAFSSPGSDVNEDIEDLQQYLQNAADNAPDEISADFQIIANAYAAFFGILQEYEIDFSNPATFATLDAEAQAELQAALEAVGTEEVIQASENISQWFEDNCS